MATMNPRRVDVIRLRQQQLANGEVPAALGRFGAVTAVDLVARDLVIDALWQAGTAVDGELLHMIVSSAPRLAVLAAANFVEQAAKEAAHDAEMAAAKLAEGVYDRVVAILGPNTTGIPAASARTNI